jgi:general secretion pathway protein G
MFTFHWLGQIRAFFKALPGTLHRKLGLHFPLSFPHDFPFSSQAHSLVPARVRVAKSQRDLYFAAQRRSKDAGFTLIEIMVVIAIIGILATLIVPKIMGRPDEARMVAAKQDVGTIVQALKLYRLDIGRYPTTDQGLKALVEKPTSEPVPQNWKMGGYLDSLPKDPWGNIYQYANPGTNGEIDVYSYGSDGKPGGTGLDADIGNWQPKN